MRENEPMTDALSPTARTTVRRLPARASYDREVVHAILDEALICHVGFATAAGPFVLPTAHWRIGDATSTFTARPPAACCASLSKAWTPA